MILEKCICGESIRLDAEKLARDNNMSHYDEEEVTVTCEDCGATCTVTVCTDAIIMSYTEFVGGEQPTEAAEAEGE